MDRPYAPLRANTQPIRTLSVFVGSVEMDFAPKLAMIGAVVVENELFALQRDVCGAPSATKNLLREHFS